MRGLLNYTEDEKTTCTTFDDYNMAMFSGRDFAVGASGFRHQNCLGKI